MSLVDAAASESRRVKELQAQLKSAHKTIEQQQQQIEDVRKARRLKFPTGKKQRKGGTFVRVIIPDTHGCFIDAKAAAIFLTDLESLHPAEIVLLGDHLDCAGWLAEHHPFQTVQEARYSFEDDVEAANSFLDEVQSRARDAAYHYLSGNHEDRLEAFVVKATRQHPRDAAYMRTMFSPEGVLGLAKREIQFYHRTENYCGLRARGVLKLGHCYFVHGTTHAKHAATIHLQQHKRCIVFGHVHRRMQAGTSDVLTEMDAWCPGCLCQMEPMWMHSMPTEWGHGYGLQLVNPDGTFLHINVPIVGYASYLLPLTERLQ